MILLMSFQTPDQWGHAKKFKGAVRG